jgi:hypothetical protein
MKKIPGWCKIMKVRCQEGRIQGGKQILKNTRIFANLEKRRRAI